MPLGWLHVNGVSLSTDIQQQGLYTSDSRSKHVTSPIPPSTPPIVSSPSSFPLTTAMNDTQQSNRYYERLENGESPKKIFMDRQIQRVKSLPGLIKGTALCHHASSNYNQSANPSNSNPPATTTTTNNNANNTNNSNSNNNNNGSYGGTLTDNDDDSTPSRQYPDRASEGRRPRVSFSDYNRVQFFEGNTELPQPTVHRRHRHRGSRKPSAIITHNQVSPPSIQQSQSLYMPYRPSSRQQPVTQELNIKKQLIFPSPRPHSSRVTQLPDILNQSLPADTPIHEKYTIQREKVPLRLPEAANDVPVNSSAEISRESTRAGGVRFLGVAEYQDSTYKQDIGEAGVNSLLNSSSLSSSLSSRQRSLRSLSLRHQFHSSTRAKLIPSSSNFQSPTNQRRSASLKHLATRYPSTDEESDDPQTNGFISTLESRPVTGVNSSRQQMRNNYIIHFNSKPPSNGNSITDFADRSRHSFKSNFNDSSQERFQNLLKVVRPPYAAGINSSNHETKLQTMVTNANGSVRSSRTNSGHGSHEFHVTTNTIYV